MAVKAAIGGSAELSREKKKALARIPNITLDAAFRNIRNFILYSCGTGDLGPGTDYLRPSISENVRRQVIRTKKIVSAETLFPSYCSVLMPDRKGG
jgi:hypothetical protein